MRKIAIFVEGQAELIFVREYLLKRFDYQISLICEKLLYNERFDPVDYCIENDDASFHFRIIDVGGDNAVLSNILKHELLFWNLGFEKIIGLRDMFSTDYKKVVKQPLQIKEEINHNFIVGANNTIRIKAIRPEQIKFCFAIMEIEAWLLGIPNIWLKKGISVDKLTKIFKNNYSETDPEVAFFHPAEIIKVILGSYDKHAGEVESLVGTIEKQDFEQLQISNKCQSFKQFAQAI